MSGKLENNREEVWIQRCLIEHVVTDPLTAGNFLRPRIILPRIADDYRKQRTLAQLLEVNDSKDESEDGDQKKKQQPSVTARSLKKIGMERQGRRSEERRV